MPQGIFGQLPAGLRGYVAAEQNAQARDANQLARAQGIFGLQEAMEMKPLQRALLQAQVAQAQQDADIMRRYLAAQGQPGGATGRPVAPGDMSTPTGPMNAYSGQPIPQAGPSGAAGALPESVRLGLLHPRLAPLAKEEAKFYEPRVVAEGGGVYVPGQGFVGVRPKVGEGLQPTGYGPTGELSGVRQIPGYAQGRAGIVGAEAGAQEQARAERDLVTVPGVGDQPPTYTSRARLLPGAGGAAVPRAPGPAIPSAPRPVPVAGPSPVQAAQQAASAAYGSRVATQGAEADVAQHETAIAAQDSIAKMDQLLTHLKTSEAITGMGAEVFKGIERMKVLVADSERAGRRVSDTELLDAMMGSDIFPMIKALGIGARGLDTPAEREFLRQVMSGTIPMNKQTLVKMTELRKDIAERAITRWDRRVDAGELDRYFTATGRTKERLGQGRRATDTDALLRQADEIIRRTRPQGR